MPKPRITVQKAASTITGSILRFSAQTTQQIGDLFVPRASFLKRALSSRQRNAERLEALKLYCDIVIPHVAVAEYNLEHGDYWDRTNSDIVDLIRQFSFQAIIRTFERAGCAVIDANFFVRAKAERFALSGEIPKDYELPSKMSAAELVGFLGPSRISTYKELWAEDQERTLRLQRPSTGDLLAKVHQHWRGSPPSRDWDELQFNLMLEGSLFGLNLVITRACYDIEIAWDNACVRQIMEFHFGVSRKLRWLFLLAVTRIDNTATALAGPIPPVLKPLKQKLYTFTRNIRLSNGGIKFPNSKKSIGKRWAKSESGRDRNSAIVS